MNPVHVNLAAGRWKELSLVEQMANIGSEVERCLNWRARGNADLAERAFERSLELIDLTLDDPKNRHRSREVARVREIWAGHGRGGELDTSSDESWRRYFLSYAVAARRNR